MRKFTVAIGVMIGAMAVFTMFFMVNFGRETGREEAMLARLDAAIGLPFHVTEEEAPPEDAVPVITAETLITHEYYNPDTDGFYKVTGNAAPILVGKTEEDTALFFADWTLVSFDVANVHLRQNRGIQTRGYIIGAHNGYIAVFYDNGTTGIKELTARPVAALAEEEQKRLAEGIEVRGNEELMRALEDFGS